MAKQKTKFEGDVEILSELPLELCYQCLKDLESDQIAVDFERVNSDIIRFRVRLMERGIVRAEGRGSLRRWQGTLTRVDCDVRVNEGILRWLLLFSGLFLLIMVSLPLLIFLVAAVDTFIWMGISLLFMVVLAVLVRVVNYYAPVDDTPQNLLDIITSALRVYP